MIKVLNSGHHSDSLLDAKGLLSAITDSDFIASLVVTNGCLGYVLGITPSLHAEAKDNVQAVQEIYVALVSLNNVRKNINDNHQEWYEEIAKMCAVGDTISSQKVWKTMTSKQRPCRGSRDILPTLHIYPIGKPHIDRL